MDVKLNKEPSSVFKELSGYEHLLTEEVSNFLVDWRDIVVTLLRSGNYMNSGIIRTKIAVQRSQIPMSVLE